MKLLGILVGALFVSNGASAAWQTTNSISDFSITMDNGVTYINHPQFIAPCLNARIEIRDSAPYSNDYAKRITAAIFMAKAMGKGVAFTWNDATAPLCLLNSISVSN